MRLAQLPQRPCQARLRAVHAVHAAEIGLALGHGRQAAIEGRPGRIRNDLGRQVGTASRKPNGGFKLLAFFWNLQKSIEKSLGRAQIMVELFKLKFAYTLIWLECISKCESHSSLHILWPSYKGLDSQTSRGA